MIFTQIKGYEMGTFNDPNFWTSGGGGALKQKGTAYFWQSKEW